MPATRSPPIADPPIPSSAADVVARCASVSDSARVIAQASRRCAGIWPISPSMPAGSAAPISPGLSRALVCGADVPPSRSIVNGARSRGGDQSLAFVEHGVPLIGGLRLGVHADERLGAAETDEQPGTVGRPELEAIVGVERQR